MTGNLRERARARLREGSESDPARMSADDVQSLVEELRIHQFELEIQNEELRATEGALAESRDRYRMLYESAPVGYLTLDADGGIIELNPAAGEILGHDRERLLGVRMAELVAPESLSTYRRHAQAARTSGAVQSCELALHNLSGRRWHVQFESTTGGAPPAHVHCALIDITARKHAEHDLERLNADLEQQVVERTARLRRLAVELTSTEQRERRRMAAVLHDDLQQLLVAARMQLGRGHDRVDDETALEAIGRVDRLLDETVTVARNLTRRLRPPVLYEAGLVPALKALSSEFEAQHGLRVAVDGGAEEPPLSADARAFLFESTRELLFNVAKYAGVDEATVQIRSDGGRLRLRVRDGGGSGFDADACAAQAQGQSEGFGLFRIRERLTALGGGMAIESAVDQGTCIELEVPLASVAPEGSGQPRSESQGATGERAPAGAVQRPRVLIVDDHAMVRQGLARIVREDERVVFAGEAGDGVEAIEMMVQEPSDVVLMDVNMPCMNGIEATHEIRRRCPTTAIIGLSVQSDDATIQAMQDAGAAAFLSKTGDADELVATILDVTSTGPA